MIDALLATLERDAGAEIARVTEDARARAAELSAASDQRIAARRAAVLGQREADARAQHERALADARAAARVRVLSARAALLDRVFTALITELPRLAASAAYRAQLPSQVEDLLRFAGDDPVTVECAPALSTTLRQVIRTNGRLRIRPDSRIRAGFRLRTADGLIEIDASLENQVERLRPQLTLEALAALSA